MTVGISYSDDIEKAKTVIRNTLRADERVLRDPEPLVVVQALGESSVDLRVGPYCSPDDYWGLRFDMLERIKVELDANGLHIPCPQRDVPLFQQ